jgi:phosphomannomutase
MNDGSALIARPSGTEPLIKIYFSIPAENEEKATQKFESYKEALTKML